MEDTDINDALLVPDAHEDSVDIYEGLDVGCFSSNAVKSPANNSQLKDSMDLYEEIVTEEQQSRETLYTELKSRFQAAQNQIKELRKRLEQMEMQNTGLNIENCRLKKNISALLRTARQEVTRKDAEIQRLNQWSGKGRHHHQSHVNNLRGKTPSNWTSTGSSSIRPPPQPPSNHLPPPPPPPPTPPPPPPPPPPSLSKPPRPPTSPPRENQPSRDPPQRSRTESSSLTNQPAISCTETRTSKVSSHSHSKSSSRERDCEISNKQFDYSQQSDCDKNKSKRREEKYQSCKLSDSTDRRCKSGSYPSKDCHGPEKNRSHKTDKDTRQKHDSSSGKSRTYLNVEGHHRSDRSKSPPPDGSHSAAPSDSAKERSRERRPDKAKLATPGSEQSTSCSSKEVHSRDHRRSSDRNSRNSDSKDRKRSSSNQHSEHHTDSCKEREDDRLSKDHKRKRERRREEEISRKHQRSTSRERERRKSKDSNQGKVEGHSKERHEKTHDALKRSSKEPRVTVKSSVEENSPNRKLCFMETLNLTLSPIKKPTLPFDATQGDLPPVDEAAENREGHNKSLQSMCVEDMCVVDEAEISELEAECKDVAGQSSDVHKDLGPERSDERCDDVEDTQEDDKKSLTEAAAGKLVGDSAVQTTSAPSHPIDTVENVFTPKSPESSSPVATEGDVSNKSALNSQVDKSALPVVTDSVGDTSDTSSTSEQHTSKSFQKGNNAKQTVVCEPVVLEMKAEPPKTAEQKCFPVKDASPSKESPVADSVPKSRQSSPASSPRDCLPAASSSPIQKEDACPKRGSPKDMEAVSSTISLDSLPQEGLSLPEAIYVLTQTNEEAGDNGGIAAEPSSSTSCIAVSKVSSTTEETSPPAKYNDLTFTPKKGFSPGKSPENNVEPSSSVPLLHDEDSMMRTLNSLKRIPDAISPLRSPIRIAKRSHLHIHCKPGHVKSLQKDFSSTAVDVNSKKLDVNKENKYPGSPVNHDTQIMADKGPDLRSRLSDTELEEGEILSESDEAAAGSPVPANKKLKLARPVRNKPSPKPALNRKSEDRCVAVKEAGESPGSSARSPKSRFKTVCPAATKASFSDIDEIMETFKLVRTEIRKKYMKLHKTFPRKSFYGMMDNFQESFLEFVDGAHFGQICNQAEELKSKLKKLIASVFSKVSNNGIVKRIFEQQAVDLKQKLWDFVDVQVEYLFKDVHTTLKSLCKTAQAEDKRPSGSDRVSRQPSVKKPPIQQKEAQSAPTSLNQIKPCAVVPYKTGLGSRGKDIRITHMEKDLHPTDGPKTQTVIDFLPPKSISSTPEKSMTSLVVSQSGSLLDKTDFELLTEQQASSLTFNLVRDSQMGEIFKCLLQGSDLLENSGMSGDSTAWSLGTPRKDGERLISITTPTKYSSPSKLLSPTKFNTPSKLIATWSSISPRKMSSPRSKDHIPLNPALFDESCLLEVPSENRGMVSSSMAAQRSYSILTEDLAVSLTIPSPLKSDSHLSFLQPSSMPSMHIMSTPDSVISAHISEDALLDGEDATEQDIHLALDTDNSSCSSSSSVGSVALATSFTFKPDIPMQALVMEKSNDHFIVKIRQTTTSANNTLIADETLSQTLTEDDQQHGKSSVATPESHAGAHLSDQQQNKSTPSCALSEESRPSFAESSGICQAAAGSESRHSRDEGLALTEDPRHEKDRAITRQSSSNLCFSEEPQKLSESLKTPPVITPSENSSLSGAQSSDHLFVQMSQTASGEHVSAEESSSQTCHEGSAQTQKNTSKAQKNISPPKRVVSDNSPRRPTESCEANQKSRASPSDSEREGTELSEPDRSLAVAEDTSSTSEKEQRESDRGRKRKKRQDKFKAKRSRKEEVESREEKEFNPETEDNESKSPSAPLSPNSLSANNVVRKKGEVVMAWTRDEDRTILMDLKIKGASRETFSALAEKLNKPSGQIAHRFHQLMKLFKKQEKMDP